MVEVFVQDAEARRTENNSVKLWLQNFKDVAYEADDVLYEFSYEILRSKVEIQSQIERRVLNFCSPSNSVAFRFEMAYKIKDILKSLDDLNNLANEFSLQISPIFRGSNVETISFVNDFNIFGKKTNVPKVVDFLVNPKDDQVVIVVPIVGLEGLGKTTLAKLVYNHPNVERHFDVKFWLCVILVSKSDKYQRQLNKKYMSLCLYYKKV